MDYPSPESYIQKDRSTWREGGHQTLRYVVTFNRIVACRSAVMHANVIFSAIPRIEIN